MSNNRAERLEKLTPAQRQLLFKNLRQQAVSPEVAQSIPRRPQQDGPLPLSFSQERQWLLNQLSPDSPAYNVPVALKIEGLDDASVLEKVLSEIVRRHEILRTTFPTVDGNPTQVIAPASPLSVPVTDLRHVAADELEATTYRLVAEELRKLFDLSTGPLFRARLFRQAEATYVLVITMPHIVTDGWSMGQFFQEMATISKAYLAGEPSPLAELPIQYADYAVWQRRRLQGAVLDEHVAYWKQQFAEAPSVIDLPTDRPRPAVQNYRGAVCKRQFPHELHDALQALSQREGVTMFMLLVAALKTLLHRYSNQNEIVVGSYLANRNFAETEKLIGFFVNTVALRTSLAGNPTFRELLGRVREVALGAYAHQELPFERVLEEVQPERSLSHAPLFQIGLNFGNISAPEAIHLPGVTISRLKRGGGVVVGSSQLDLTLDIQGLESGLSASLLYDTTLFDETTIARLLEHFEILLEGIVRNPNQPVLDLPLIAQAERQQLLEEWNNTASGASADACVQQVFEAQTERTPDAVAVVCENEQLSYRELNERANQLAHHLIKLGVEPETRVGICLTRSIDMVVGLLGILKSGGAYVPLDPDYPQERLSLMLSLSRAQVLVTEGRAASRLPEQSIEVVRLDEAWSVIAGESTENPLCSTRPGNPAYVIYTSGSTGQPKGVVVEHRSLVGYAATARESFALTASDRVLQFTSISFDTSAEEIYPSLTSGATLVLRTDAMLNSMSGFARRCEEWGITVLDLPTAYWHELVARLGVENITLPPSIRLVIIGGERALPERLQIWRASVGSHVRLLNTYGPTETTIVATSCELTTLDEERELLREVSIGAAIRDVQVYALDSNLNPTPIGVPGELHIGGNGLARGYLDCPELTAERFIPNPFSRTPGARLYKSGDLASYGSDGKLAFHGRVDSQVKVRGFRIDLGEIEAVLAQHEAVQQAVVLVSKETPGDVRLAAYIEPVEGRRLPLDELRGFLSKKLPAHMLPSGFVLLDKLPLTPNGKIDRKKLIARATTTVRELPFVAPSSLIEEVLANIWADVLKIKELSVNDNFFKLGGHSLLATQVIYQLQTQLNLELPLRSFFEEPTIAGLSLIIEEKLLEEIESISEEEAEDLSLELEA